MKYLTSFFIFLFLFSLLVLTSCSSQKGDLPPFFDGYSFSKEVLLTSSFFDYDDGFEKLTIKSKDDVDKQEGFNFVDDQAKLFESIFETRRVSYPGPTTKNIVCPDEFKPKKLEKEVDGKLIYFRGYANSNFVAGACSEDLINKSMVLALIYCSKTRTFYEVKYYVPPNETTMVDSFIEKLSCE